MLAFVRMQKGSYMPTAYHLDLNLYYVAMYSCVSDHSHIDHHASDCV